MLKIINKLIENDDSTDDDLREGLDIEKILEDNSTYFLNTINNNCRDIKKTEKRRYGTKHMF